MLTCNIGGLAMERDEKAGGCAKPAVVKRWLRLFSTNLKKVSINFYHRESRRDKRLFICPLRLVSCLRWKELKNEWKKLGIVLCFVRDKSKMYVVNYK